MTIRHKIVHKMPDGCVATHTAEASGSPDTTFTDFGMLHIDSGQYWFNPLAATVRGHRVSTIVCPKSSASIIDRESGEQWWPDYMSGSPEPQLPARLQWSFQPLDTSEDEVVIRIPGYAGWRPEAGAGGGRGNSLVLNAELRGRDGGPPSAKAVRFEWELPQISREPGFALNAPVTDPGRDRTCGSTPTPA